MKAFPPPEGWYWHPRSQRPAYVFEGIEEWHARFLWRDPENQGALQHGGLLCSVNIALTPELAAELVPLENEA